MGAPTLYTDAIADRIVRLIERGTTTEDVGRIKGMPGARTIRDWCKQNPDFNTRYQEAKDLGHDAIASRTRRTARGMGRAKGGDSTGDVQRDKLIIEQDNKLLSKWSPRYADKVRTETVTMTHEEWLATLK